MRGFSRVEPNMELRGAAGIDTGGEDGAATPKRLETALTGAVRW
jgi:hypothetical protein